MSNYNHGVRTTENATSMSVPQKIATGLQVVIGTAPVHILKNPSAVTNTPVLVEKYEEAVEKLGMSTDWDKFSVCQSIDANFSKLGTSPVVVINVLDVDTNKEALTAITWDATTNKEYTFDSDLVIRKSIEVKSGTNKLAEDTDYVISVASDNKITISLLSTSTYYSESSLSITGNKVDFTDQTMTSQVIGGYSSTTGKNKGISCVNDVFLIHQLVPGQILAPGYSQKPTVAAALCAAAVNINGEFTAQALIDLPSDTVTKCEDLPTAKTTIGVSSSIATLLWPKVKRDGKIYAYSAWLAALSVNVDSENGGLPSASPSNKALGIDAVVLADGTEVVIDKRNANNYANAYGIVTAINWNGFRSWGNNTAAYPITVDPKDRWICVRRFFSWYRNRLLVLYSQKVDEPTNPRLPEAICDSENIWFNANKANMGIAGGKIEYRAEDNPIENILAGSVKFNIKIASYTPAEDIQFVIEFDPSILQTAIEESLGGE